MPFQNIDVYVVYIIHHRGGIVKSFFTKNALSVDFFRLF